MRRVLFILLVLLTLVLTACGGPEEVYLCSDGAVGGGQPMPSGNVLFFCPDGRSTLDYNSCTFSAQVLITQEDAEMKALSFVNGYLLSNGWSSTLVNVNIVEGNWLAQLIVSKFDEDPFETVIEVDGLTGFAKCHKNCDFLPN